MKVKYAAVGPFHDALRHHVDKYFERTRLSRHADVGMYIKTAVVLCWLVASWVLLVFVAQVWWQAVVAAVLLGLAASAVGFNIQHDANHGGYSAGRTTNRIFAWTLDFIGGSSFLWSWKHNVLHHTYTNLPSMDLDLHAEPMLRMAPFQKLRRAHRFQHLYAWLLYGLLPLKWQMVDDFQTLIRGEVAGQKFPRPPPWTLAGVLVGKVVFFTWAFVIPALFHPLWQVLVFYLVASATLGVTLASVFQVAHCVSEADFPLPAVHGDRMPREWAVYQVETTVNFARRNRVLTWYLGGLNFQIEHHLFPRIAHIHYPELSRIVEATCLQFGIRYVEHRSMTSALLSHFRWLRRMGQPVSLGGG